MRAVSTIKDVSFDHRQRTDDAAALGAAGAAPDHSIAEACRGTPASATSTLSAGARALPAGGVAGDPLVHLRPGTQLTLAIERYVEPTLAFPSQMSR